MQNFGEASIDFQFAFDDGHQHVRGDRGPDLSLHRVGRGAEKRFDAEVLFDPFEEQFDLPTGFVELRDGQCRQGEVVGQEQYCPAISRTVSTG